MEGQAIAGELPFKWKTKFDFLQYGGWLGNQEGRTYEKNILVVIPGKSRKQAVVFGDHYDTAYMEDIYDKELGGSGARLAARGADDNYSASSTLLQAAPIFLKLSKEGKLECDIWLLHLTGEEFPADCMGARNFCQSLVEKNLILKIDGETEVDLSDTEIAGVYIMDMIGHNRDTDRDIFQISPGRSAASINLAFQAHLANMIWNESADKWNMQPERLNLYPGKRIKELQKIPDIARHISLKGEVRTQYNPHSSLFNTDCQIFSDTGVPVVLFMENYDINRSGYHDTKDTLENIDLDYGAALAAIAIETVARVASLSFIKANREPQGK
jgi:Zn-dependent M28 family amino/carboxypeptidase